MRGLFIPIESCRGNCPGEYGLPERNSAKRGGVETTEGVKRIPFDRRPLYCLVQESEIECRVVPDENCTLAMIFAHCLPHLSKDSLQSIAFVDCRPQRMMRIYTVDGQRRRFEIRALERFDVVASRLATCEYSTVTEVHEDSRYLE